MLRAVPTPGHRSMSQDQGGQSSCVHWSHSLSPINFFFFTFSKDPGEGGRKPEPDLLRSPTHGALHLCGYVEERSSITSALAPAPSLPPSPLF